MTRVADDTSSQSHPIFARFWQFVSVREFNGLPHLLGVARA